MGFFDFLTGGGLGAVAGAAGAIGGKIVELKLEGEKRETLRVQLAHELALRDKDMAQARLEAESKLRLQELDADSKAAIADLDALAASHAADRATYGDHVLGRIVDFVRGLTRPVLTFAALGLVIFTTSRVLGELKRTPLTAEQIAQHMGEVGFLCGVCIMWWFGSRPASGARSSGKR